MMHGEKSRAKSGKSIFSAAAIENFLSPLRLTVSLHFLKIVFFVTPTRMGRLLSHLLIATTAKGVT